MESNYMLFIDIATVEEKLIDYFAKFNLNIVQQDHITEIPADKQAPYAVLIHWSILKDNLKAITYFYDHYTVPILVLDDKADEEACVLALESGADDFLMKPLNPRALHARITAIRRRVSCEPEKNTADKISLTFANWHLTPASRQLFNENNQEIVLSAGEYDLLLIFVQRPQRVLDREFLLQVTKNSALNPFDRRIDVQISRLRQKIETDPKKPKLIKTIRNNGYMFTSRVIKQNL